ncbi:MAG: TRAP transporter substrate-binding protein, partial [Hyphomicrobiales bacterium]
MKSKAPDQPSGTAGSAKVAIRGRNRGRAVAQNPARRDVLALGGAGAIGLASPAIAQSNPEPIVWNMATAWPRKAPGYFSAAKRLATSITSMSGGRLQVTAHAAGEKVAVEKIFNAVSEGTMALGHSSAHLWTKTNPAFQFFTGIPFGMTAPEHAGWIRFGGGQSLWNRAYATHGIQPFLAGNTGLQGSGWFRREIRNPEDFNGLKIRISGIGADVLRHLGTEPVNLPPSEIYPAMQAEKIDGIKLAGPWNDLDFGLHKLA